MNNAINETKNTLEATNSTSPKHFLKAIVRHRILSERDREVTGVNSDILRPVNNSSILCLPFFFLMRLVAEERGVSWWCGWKGRCVLQSQSRKSRADLCENDQPLGDLEYSPYSSCDGVCMWGIVNHHELVFNRNNSKLKWAAIIFLNCYTALFNV